MLSVGVVILFAVWMAATVPAQWSAQARFPTLKGLGIIPLWRFFAPNPGIYDFCLLFRDYLVDGTVTPWTEIAYPKERTLLHAAWNPGKRVNKAIFDFTGAVSMAALRSREEVQLSIAYIALLSYVSALPRTGASAFTQFALLRTSGQDPRADPELVFQSAAHRL